MIPNHRTKIAGVIGWPISHSKSPKVHGFWLNEYNVDGVYHALSVSPKKLSRALTGISALGFRGVNVTIPHKVEALALCDKTDNTAKRIGAVNTVTICKDGSLSGTNSDAYGFIENLHNNSSWTASLGPAVILGAGGAARAVAVALSDAGVDQIRIINRTPERAEALIADTQIENAVIESWRDRHEALEGAGLLVNSTSLGMAGHEPLDINLSMLPRSAVVNDIVYEPLITELLKASKNRGNEIVDGLDMLLHQAKVGFHLWYGVSPEVTSDQRAYVLG
tara:strand:+ start:1517 stop:2353 length:837 start_codon:yes stop_codon:yes gene_type:complete